MNVNLYGFTFIQLIIKHPVYLKYRLLPDVNPNHTSFEWQYKKIYSEANVEDSVTKFSKCNEIWSGFPFIVAFLILLDSFSLFSLLCFTHAGIFINFSLLLINCFLIGIA